MQVIINSNRLPVSELCQCQICWPTLPAAVHSASNFKTAAANVGVGLHIDRAAYKRFRSIESGSRMPCQAAVSNSSLPLTVSCWLPDDVAWSIRLQLCLWVAATSYCKTTTVSVISLQQRSPVIKTNSSSLLPLIVGMLQVIR